MENTQTKEELLNEAEHAAEDLRRGRERLAAFRERAGYLLERATALDRQARASDPRKPQLTDLDETAEEADLLLDVRNDSRKDDHPDSDKRRRR